MDSLAGVAPVENCGMTSTAQATTRVPIRANFFTVTLLWGCGSWPNRTGPFYKTLDEARLKTGPRLKPDRLANSPPTGEPVQVREPIPTAGAATGTATGTPCSYTAFRDLA